ncbi:TIR domain-containing protein [Actinocorallia populi]|uniref:TIR domain-containing protein n=1 Tax=Actinocorallia populi TaxID=2079200 RepID=UPI001E47093D|nr:TIR domain-containing protein [Actinocorallia populi]
MTGPQTEIFVSYSPADERWASWIAWELEAAGYRTMLQAWDFVPGTNFIDFMDRGVSEAAVVIAVLSRNYMRSRYGRMEWQAALRASPDDPSAKLVTVRLEDCELEGLLATITYVDLVGVTDEDAARDLLLTRVREALAGRAKPEDRPPSPFPPAAPPVPAPAPGGGRQARRAPAVQPAYPPEASGGEPRRQEVSILHLAGPRFGWSLADEPFDAASLQARIWAELTELNVRPDLLVVSGDLTESGSRRECAAAADFLTGLRTLLSLEPHRVVLVPGARDVTKAACRAYFNSCEADDEEPEPPYWPKWRHFGSLFSELYRGVDHAVFDSAQPWTLFPVPELRVVVAGLNTTMALSHRDDDRYGMIGPSQAAWFAERLRAFGPGWLRLGVVHHSPLEGDPDRLRDADLLDRLVAPGLDLVLHGRQGERGETASGTLCLPALAPGRHQVLTVDSGGLTLLRPGAGPERVDRAGIFHPEPPAPAVPAPREAPDGRPADPLTLLLEQITEACETRFPGARTRPVAAEPPHLLVSRLEDGFVRQFRIGAHVGEVGEAEVAAFLRQVHAGGDAHGSELVFLGPPPPRSLREDALRRGVRLRSLTEFQGLLDLSSYVTGQALRLAGDRLYPPDLYVPQRYRELDGDSAAVRDDLTGAMLDLLAADHGRFVLLLGDFGRGKTFALRELARRIPGELPHLIPILIELRRLDKAHSVDALVAAHLAAHGEDLIDLRAFHYMLRQGRIVLLFDGFDELVTRVTYERAADHLEALLAAAEGKAKIVVASRTQHFKSHAQVFTVLGERVGTLPGRRVLGIADFTPAQIRAFLVNRYGNAAAADRRMAMLRGVEDLLGLAQNPRMLGFIADLPEERLHAVALARHAISPADLYQEILASWLRHEEERVRGVPGAPAGLSLDELWRAARILALRLWETGETYLRVDDLTEVAAALTDLADGTAGMSQGQTAHAVGAGSLLMRTDEGLFGFIHGSVAEWLVARHIADELSGGVEPAALARRPLSQLTVDFLCDLAGSRVCQAWTARVLRDAEAGDVRRANAIKITTRLRTPARTDLRGARLRGEDLSYRDLSEVDLTGADLTDVQLVGADLSRAVLRGARLCGARLDEARLAGADLTGADLSRARLVRADLRDAVLGGSRWTRAAVIETAGAATRRAELRGAALVPGSDVEAQFSPSAIGVPYGFHFQSSRLPSPAAYSPDGATVALGGEDGAVLLCDSRTGLPLRTLQGHRDRAYAVLYAGEDLLVTGAADGTLRLWDTATGRQRHAVDVHPDGVWPVVADAGGALVAAGDATGTVRIWRTASMEPHASLPGHAAPVYTCAFSPDGRFVVTGDAAGTVRVWSGDGGLLHTMEGEGAVFRLIFSADGLLITGDELGRIRVWDPPSGALLRELTGHTGRVYALDARDGLLVSGDTEGSVRVWDLTGRYAPRSLAGHTGAIYRAAFDPGGSRVVTSDSDGAVRLWNLERAGGEPGPDFGRLLHSLPGHRGAVWPPVFRPDGAQVTTVSNDGTARLWDTATGVCRHTLRGHGRRITSVQFSPDGTMLATAGNDGVVRIWDPATGVRVHELAGVSDRLTSATFSPVGGRLGTATNDGGVHLWQAAGGAFERELSVETDHVWAQAFSPDGTILATANDDDSVRLWYHTTGRQVVNLADHRGRVRCIDFSPDGSLIATGCDDRLVRIWDPGTGALVSTLAGHGDRVYKVRFDRTGTLLASASNDGTARIWDPSSATALHLLQGHSGRLWSTAFSPDGRLLATAGDDTVIRLWETGTGRLVQTLRGHTRRIWSIDFSPDGRLLAGGGDDGSVILWRTGDEGAARHCTLLGLAEGWAAVTPDGRYKYAGDVAGQFWWAAGLCRFEPGELDEHLPSIRRIPLEEPLNGDFSG